MEGGKYARCHGHGRYTGPHHRDPHSHRALAHEAPKAITEESAANEARLRCAERLEARAGSKCEMANFERLLR